MIFTFMNMSCFYFTHDFCILLFLHLYGDYMRKMCTLACATRQLTLTVGY